MREMPANNSITPKLGSCRGRHLGHEQRRPKNLFVNLAAFFVYNLCQKINVALVLHNEKRAYIFMRKWKKLHVEKGCHRFPSMAGDTS
jgi:hypothetical protein